ncbi:MAG: hypothetical protein F6K30_07175 [Cyanothece sp. SIO2G6]|nr:hypothetical protein [Cyanothece sp. SIO2G6]
MSTTRIEAEDLFLDGFFTSNGSFASDGQYIGLFARALFRASELIPGESGTASYNFSGENGYYTIEVGYYDENDGVGNLAVDVDGQAVAQWDLDEATSSGGPNAGTFRVRTIENVQLLAGQTLTLTGTSSNPEGEWTRIDYIDLTFVGATLPEPVPGAIAFSSSTYSVNEDGTTTQAITLIRTGGSTGEVSVTLTPTDGTATAGADYDATPITVTFAEGVTSQTVLIPITDDAELEDPETVNLALSAPTNGATLGSQDTAMLTIDATLTIEDNEIPPGSAIEFEAEGLNLTNYRVENASVASGGSLITLLRTNSTTGSATGQFTGSSGLYDVELTYFDENDGNGQLEVIIGDDQTVVFMTDNPGSGAVTNSSKVTKTILSGIQVENGEVFTINGTAESGEFARVDKIAFIPGAAPLPGAIAFSSSTYSVNEDGITTQAITLIRTGGSAGEVSVTLTPTNDTAIAGADYDATPITVTFAEGVTSQTVLIPIIDDTEVETAETISLTLSAPTNGATLGSQATATLTIEDNDVLVTPGTIAFSSSTYSVNEDGATAQAITLTRTGGSDGEVSVTLTPTDGTATAGDDYDATPITVTFADGVTRRTVSIPITNDTAVEAAETVSLTLSGPTNGATLGSQATATLTIENNDFAPPPTVRFEAEDLTLDGYFVETDSFASNGQFIGLFDSSDDNVPGDSGTASFIVSQDGNYTFEVAYYDENDGVANIALSVGGQLIEQWDSYEDTPRSRAAADTLRTRTVDNVQLVAGQTVTLTGTSSNPQGDWARLDYIDVTLNPEPTFNVNTGILSGNAQNNIIMAGDGNQIIQPGAGDNTVDGGDGIDTISYDYDVAGVTVDLAQGTATRNFTTTDDKPLTLLPLGDSNTRGFPNNASIGGYRVELWRQLTNTYGFNLDFVGQAQSGPADIDLDHEGRGGLTIDELTDNVNNTRGFNSPRAPRLTNIEHTLWVNGMPDMVLLMAGTNDLLQGDTVDNALAELATLVDRITTYAPDTQVLLGSIIPNTRSAELQTSTAEFNSRVEAEVAAPRIAQGDNVQFVDIANIPFTAAQLHSDGVHLTAEGYDVMSEVWQEAVLSSPGGEDSLSNIENVTGSSFDDLLQGDSGANVIDGRGGNDELLGRGGADQFVLAPGNGSDRILDFEDNIDLLGLAGGLSFGSLGIAQGTGSASNDTLITYGTETLAALVNITANTITESDFILA